MKNKALGKLSIELKNKGNNQYSLEITSGLNNAQIDVLTDILCQGHKGEHGEVFSKLVEETIDTLAKILYSYDRKLNGENVIFKD
jgi:hypothetical protein